MLCYLIHDYEWNTGMVECKTKECRQKKSPTRLQVVDQIAVAGEERIPNDG